MWKAKSWTGQCGIYQHFMHMLVIMLRWGFCRLLPLFILLPVALSHILECRITNTDTHWQKRSLISALCITHKVLVAICMNKESFFGLFYPKCTK
jgi:hypothetical protein